MIHLELGGHISGMSHSSISRLNMIKKKNGCNNFINVTCGSLSKRGISTSYVLRIYEYENLFIMITCIYVKTSFIFYDRFQSNICDTFALVANKCKSFITVTRVTPNCIITDEMKGTRKFKAFIHICNHKDQ